MIALFLTIMAAIAIFAGPLVYAIVYDQKMLRKEKQDDIDWLENEKLQPKYRVGFLVNVNGNTLPIVTNTFEPAMTTPGSPYNMKYTSKMRAQIHLENSYKNGFFTDEAGVTYPTCQINQAWVEVSHDILS